MPQYLSLSAPREDHSVFFIRSNLRLSAGVYLLLNMGQLQPDLQHVAATSLWAEI